MWLRHIPLRYIYIGSDKTKTASEVEVVARDSPVLLRYEFISVESTMASVGDTRLGDEVYIRRRVAALCPALEGLGVVVAAHTRRGKHLRAIRKSIDTKRTEIAVESGSLLEHTVHIGDTAGIPTLDILIEYQCSLKHTLHIGYRRYVPARNILVELLRSAKHIAHIGNFRYVPVIYILVELLCSAKHTAHIGNV